MRHEGHSGERDTLKATGDYVPIRIKLRGFTRCGVIFTVFKMQPAKDGVSVSRLEPG